MERFTSFDGTALAYQVSGEGPPVLLLHGFAADARVNWVAPGVVDALVAAGRQAICYDARGHGGSDKPHDPAAYGDDAMLRDARGLIDHLGLQRVDVVGYSMGALVSCAVAATEPRTRSVVLGGIGGSLATRGSAARAGEIADALAAADPSTVLDPTARAFRRFADSTGADRLALAAIQRSVRPAAGDWLGAIGVPALVLVGDADILVGSPDELAGSLADARVQIVAGDHLAAVLDPAFPKAIVDFLVEVDTR